MNIVLANPRGFCAGVDRAIEIVNRALDSLGAPIYVRHEVVHNRSWSTTCVRAARCSSTSSTRCRPDATVIFSAHGVSQAVREEAAARGLKVFDATCPLVTKVHIEVVTALPHRPRCGADRASGPPGSGGHHGPVAEGRRRRQYLSGRERRGREAPGSVASRSNSPTQPRPRFRWTKPATSSPPCSQRFPTIIGPRHDDICYATQNRQDAVRELSAQCDLVLRGRLGEQLELQPPARAGRAQGRAAYLIDGAHGYRCLNGWPAPNRSVSPPALRRRKYWSKASSRICRHWAEARSPNWTANRKTWCLPCRKSCVSS